MLKRKSVQMSKYQNFDKSLFGYASLCDNVELIQHKIEEKK